VHLVRGQLSVAALRDVTKRETSHPDSLQERDLLVDCGKHHADLSLTAFMNGDTVAVGRLAYDSAHLRRPRALPLDLYAFFESVDVIRRKAARESDIILLVVLEPGMRQFVGELPVVGHDEEARAVLVQAPRRVQAGLS